MRYLLFLPALILWSILYAVLVVMHVARIWWRTLTA